MHGHLIPGAIVATIGVILTGTVADARDKNLSVLGGWMRFTDAPNLLYHHMAAQMQDLLQERSDAVAEIMGEAGWRDRQAEVRSSLNRVIGPFPERTPLNARITGTGRKSGVQMEKIVFESRPDFFVTGALFYPEELMAPAPAVLYLSGHAAMGFRSRAYLHVIQNLARKGFVVLAIDPVGQGERLQHWDDERQESWIGGPTLEHSYPGAQCFVSGFSLARHMIWDTIRALDYLVSREEVDADRIGVTGRSGGGTQTAYLAAIDDRVRAAAPENYITSFRRLIETRGLQDAEQNFFGGIAEGIDPADLLVARAPKPTLVIATTRDIFSIQGTREVYGEARPAFSALGGKRNLLMVEDDAGHSSTRKNREALYTFFQKHLNNPGDPSDIDVADWPPEELLVTETGQLATSLGGETIFSLNRSESQPLTESMRRARQDLENHLNRIVDDARRLSGFREPEDVPDSVFTGRWLREGYSVEKYFIPGEGDYVIPFLLFLPDSADGLPAAIYLHPDGKEADAGIGGPIEEIVRKGHAVLAPDLIGTGEMGPGVYRGDAYNFKVGPVSYNIWFAGIQIRRSLTGIRAGDVARTIAFLRQHESVDPDRIGIVARGELSPVALHAAVFDKSVEWLALTEPLASWADLVNHQRYRTYYVPHVVAGALGSYDLPDLAAAFAPRRLCMVNVANRMGEPASRELIESEIDVVRAAYARFAEDGSLKVSEIDPDKVGEALVSWAAAGQ